jgi:elongation factor G
VGPEQIRNVALVGHSGAGKTSVVEALAHVAGQTTRLGRVEDGNTVSDHEPEEIERGGSVGLSLVPVDWKGHKINLIDTPGLADFVGDVRAALRAADLALFVVSAVDGVEVQTEMIWDMAGEEGIARAVFVNKLDRERSDFSRVLAQLKASFGTGIAPVEVPIGSEAGLRGVAGIVSEHAFLYDGDKTTGTETDVPAEVADRVEEAHTALVEAVVENDDELLEKYFEGEQPTTDQLVGGLHHGILDGEIYPVLCGSATTLVGIDRLAELLVRDAPSPAERPTPPLSERDEIGTGRDAPTVAYVFKTMSDPYMGRISLFRVFGGSIKADANLENPQRNATGRMHNIFTVRGKEHDDVHEVVAGDIAAVAKLESTVAGDTLREPGLSTVVAPVEMPAPTMSLAVFPISQQDEEKLSTALGRAVEDDPTLVVERRPDTKQTVMSGLGDAHLEVTLNRISRRYGVNVTTDTPKVPYRETISGTADVEGKHKKQSGGRGQFGVAFVRFSPNARGAGYEFIDSVKGGAIPRQLIPAVDKGIKEALDRGMLAGYPVVDVKAEVYDGKYHQVDSDEMSFRMAGIQAVRSAGPQLKARLLEPIMRARVIVPEEYMGDIIGDINAKRGRVEGMDSAGKFRVVTAQVPLAEMQRYTVDLRSITGGRGSFSMEFDHYEEVPPQETQRVVAAAAAEDE